ncbi:MAG: hypothetical protein AAFY56_03760 [Pseudomonadota bacterium]
MSNGDVIVHRQGRVVDYIDPLVGDRLQALLASVPGRVSSPISLYDIEFIPTLHGYVWKSSDGFNRTQSVNGETTIERTVPELHLTTSARQVPDARETSLRQVATSTQLRKQPNSSTLEHKAPEHFLDRGSIASERELSSNAAHAADSFQSTEVFSEPSKVQRHHEPGHISLLGMSDLISAERDYWSKRRDFLLMLESTAIAERTAARLDLARLALGHGFGAEASAAIAPLFAADDIGPSLATLAIDAASLVLMDRLEDALEILLRKEFADDAELSLWRFAAAWRLRNWEIASENLRAAEEIITGYPTVLIGRFGPDVVRGLLKIDEVDAAKRVLAALSEGRSTSERDGTVELLRGELLISENRIGEAADRFAGAIEHAAWLSHVVARYQNTLIHQASGGSLQDVIADLEEQRLLWRGHTDEVEMLMQLADLHEETNDPTAALDVLQVARQRIEKGEFGGNGTTALKVRIKNTLKSAFADAFKNEPIEILRLLRNYDDALDELTPDEKLELLSDAAQALGEDGLEDAAIRIVFTQLQPGEEGNNDWKTQRQLAQYHFAAGRPKTTIRLLTEIPPNSRNSEDHLMLAKAYLDEGDPASALLAIDNEGGSEAIGMRQEILFKERQWTDLANFEEGHMHGQSYRKSSGGRRPTLEEIIAHAAIGEPLEETARLDRPTDVTRAERRALEALRGSMPPSTSPQSVLGYTEERVTNVNRFIEELE